jgi:hypothetical protein
MGCDCQGWSLQDISVIICEVDIKRPRLVDQKILDALNLTA